MTELKAGRELDALVAEKVFGHIRDRLCAGRMTDAANGSCWSCDSCGWYDDHGPAQHGHVPRHYSTLIDAAWLVVEEMCSNRDIQISRPARNLWHVSIRPDGYLPDFGALYMADEPTVMLAICRAALMAVAA